MPGLVCFYMSDCKKLSANESDNQVTQCAVKSDLQIKGNLLLEI